MRWSRWTGRSGTVRTMATWAPRVNAPSAIRTAVQAVRAPLTRRGYTRADRCRRARGGYFASMEASQIMTRDVATCDSSADAQAAVELMGRRRVRHLPVLAEGKLVGVLSSRDILAYLAEHAPMEEIAQLWTRAARL